MLLVHLARLCNEFQNHEQAQQAADAIVSQVCHSPLTSPHASATFVSICNAEHKDVSLAQCTADDKETLKEKPNQSYCNGDSRSTMTLVAI